MSDDLHIRLSAHPTILKDGRAAARIEVAGVEVCTLLPEHITESVLEGLVRAYLLGSASQALVAASVAAEAKEARETGPVH